MCVSVCVFVSVCVSVCVCVSVSVSVCLSVVVESRDNREISKQTKRKKEAT